jgi:cysteine desulfurase
MLYFDHNATHPLLPAARRAWLDATERFIGNPSSPHRLGARAEAALDSAREKLAGWVGCNPTDIVWTSGATEANNTAAHHLSGQPGEAWVSAIEHPCLLAATGRYFAGRYRLIPISQGQIDEAWVRAELRQSRPAFIAAMAVNNETGVLQPWDRLAEICREQNVPYLCDAAQWIGKLPAKGLGACDFVSGCAHKFGGPQGVGFLKCPPRLQPLLVGGPQEGRRRAGTENVAGVLAMIAALEERELAMRDDSAMNAQQSWRDEFERALLAALPDVEIVGGSKKRIWNTVSAIMPEQADCRQRWVVKLDKLGFAVSTGSACATGQERPSHVLSAMSYTQAQAGRVLRFSSGWETRAADWQALLGGIVQATHELVGSFPP